MDDLSTLGPLALGLLAMGVGPGSPDDPPDGTVRPSLGCCAAALVLGTLALNAAAWLRTRYKE